MKNLKPDMDENMKNTHGEELSDVNQATHTILLEWCGGLREHTLIWEERERMSK